MLPPEGFDDQTNACIGYEIRHQSLVETDGVMHSKYRNGAGEADQGQKITHSVSRRKGCKRKERPKASN